MLKSFGTRMEVCIGYHSLLLKQEVKQKNLFERSPGLDSYTEDFHISLSLTNVVFIIQEIYGAVVVDQCLTKGLWKDSKVWPLQILTQLNYKLLKNTYKSPWIHSTP